MNRRDFLKGILGAIAAAPAGAVLAKLADDPVQAISPGWHFVVASWDPVGDRMTVTIDNNAASELAIEKIHSLAIFNGPVRQQERDYLLNRPDGLSYEELRSTPELQSRLVSYWDLSEPAPEYPTGLQRVEQSSEFLSGVESYLSVGNQPFWMGAWIKLDESKT